MVSAVAAGITASTSTSVNSAIFSRISSGTSESERSTITSGWMPMPRSSLTECWVGLVLSSPVAARAGSSVTWTYRTFARPDVLAHLADGLEERQALDVADRAADLDDHDVRVARARHARDPFLDLVGDVRDDLDRAAQVVAATLLGDHRLVDAAGRDVGALGQVLVDEPLVVAQVEVGLGAVVGDEDLAVLVGRHRPRVDVDVRVELEDGDLETPRLEQAADAGGGDAFAERGGHASGHKDILRHGSGPPGVFPMLSIRGPGVESIRGYEAVLHGRAPYLAHDPSDELAAGDRWIATCPTRR